MPKTLHSAATRALRYLERHHSELLGSYCTMGDDGKRIRASADADEDQQLKTVEQMIADLETTLYKPKPTPAKRSTADKAARDRLDAVAMESFRGYLRNLTDNQVLGVIEKERAANRPADLQAAKAEAERRGID